MEEFAEFWTVGVLDSEVSETSFFQPQVHFDNSVESIAESDLKDGEFGKTRCNGLARER